MREAMRSARDAKHLTLSKAAKLVGITTGYWSYIESGQKAPTLEVAGRIGLVLGVDPVKLFAELRPVVKAGKEAAPTRDRANDDQAS